MTVWGKILKGVADVWDNGVKVAAVIGGAILGLLGGCSPLITVLCAFMAMDYITGIIVGVKGKSTKTKCGGLSSKASFEGLLRKALIMLVILMAALLDHALGGNQTIFTTTCVCYYIANEGLSIVENITTLGVPLPPALLKALEIFRKKGEINSDDKKEG